MINEVHEHPAEGQIRVRVGDKHYLDSSENFKKDFEIELPPLADNIDERIYTQGVRHALHEKNSVIDGGPMPWDIGDKIISKIDQALTRKTARDKKILEDQHAEHYARQNAQIAVEKAKTDKIMEKQKIETDKKIAELKRLKPLK